MRQRSKAAVKAKSRPESLAHDPYRLRRRRFAAGLTQVEAARLVGCHPSYLCHLERGDYGISPTMLATIAKAYGCKITDIMPPEPVAA